MDARALYDSKLLSLSFHLALDLAILRFGGFILRRICFLVIALGRYIVDLILFWWGLLFILDSRTSLTMTRRVMSSSYNQLLHHTHHFCHLLLQKSNFLSIFLMGRSTTSRHLSCARPSDDEIMTWW